MGKLAWLSLVTVLVTAFMTLSNPTLSSESTENEGLISATGTVTFNDLEGGFFGIVADNGERYDPLNLAKEFQVTGLRVRFEAKKQTEVIGFHMWGTPVEIVKMEKLAP